MSLFEPELTSDELNQKFEDFDVIEFIDSGGQGEIWKVNFEGTFLALKIYPLDKTVPTRIDREISALYNLQSNSIVKLHGHGNVDIRNRECRFFLMDYCAGQSLKDRIIDNDLLDQRELQNMLTNIGEALQSLWDLRIVHRDIKPSNILYNGSQFVLIDLGCARHIDAGTITMPGTTMGTLGYMSPEHAICRKGLTIKSDFFSLGIVAYETVTGIHPFAKRQDYIGKINPENVLNNCDISQSMASCIHALLDYRILGRPKSLNDLIKSIK